MLVDQDTRNKSAKGFCSTNVLLKSPGRLEIENCCDQHTVAASCILWMFSRNYPMNRWNIQHKPQNSCVHQTVAASCILRIAQETILWIVTTLNMNFNNSRHFTSVLLSSNHREEWCVFLFCRIAIPHLFLGSEHCACYLGQTYSSAPLETWKFHVYPQFTQSTFIVNRREYIIFSLQTSSETCLVTSLDDRWPG